MNATELGQTGLVGWREQVASKVTGPESERTPLSNEQVRALMARFFTASPATSPTPQAPYESRDDSDGRR